MSERHQHQDAKTNGVSLVHVGVSVGAATVQLVAFELILAPGETNRGARVVERKALSRRRPVSTPYLANGSLDVGALGFALLEAGANSPVLGDGVDGRVAVLSGYAAEGDNAYWTGRALADIDYSPYLCLRAGPNLGAVLAAYGGEAVARSAESVGRPADSRADSPVDSNEDGQTVLNVDLGASTVKLALCRAGEVRETAAIALGTRSIAFDAKGAITELRPAAARAAESMGLSLADGVVPSLEHRRALADRLVHCIFNVVERRPLEPLTQSLMLSGPLTQEGPIDALSFTGGGAEHVYEREERDFGDLGLLMGRAVRAQVARLGLPLYQPESPMRATLLGGMQYHLEDGDSRPVYSEPPAFAAARERDRSFVANGR
jgi:ethanolamine utilization protein EutA